MCEVTISEHKVYSFHEAVIGESLRSFDGMNYQQFLSLKSAIRIISPEVVLLFFIDKLADELGGLLGSELYRNAR